MAQAALAAVMASPAMTAAQAAGPSAADAVSATDTTGLSSAIDTIALLQGAVEEEEMSDEVSDLR